MNQTTLLALPRRPNWIAGAVLGFLATLVAAPEVFAGGPKTLKLGDIELQQNGTGYRKKSLLTLYEGSLYLQQPSADAGAIIAADAPMAIRIQITSGLVSQAKMLAAITEGFQSTTGGDTMAIAEQIRQFSQCFGDPISKNDVFVISNIPGAGILVHKNGVQKGVIAGADFKQALFAIWLGDNPADAGLKRGLLGQ